MENRKYFPAHLALSKPSGEMLHEFLVLWQRQEGSLQGMLNVFSDAGAEIALSQTSQDGADGSYVTSFFSDFSKARWSPSVVKDELAKLPFVTQVDFANMANSIFDKFFFPPILMNKDRVLIVRLSPLLRIERRLREKLGTAGTVIMFDEGKVYAKAVVDEYRTVLQTDDPQLILSNVVDGLRTTGWGIFEFRPYSAGYDVVIKSPPILKDPGPVESSFIRGLAAGIVESLFFRVVGVRDASYDISRDTLSFVLLR